MGDLAVRTRALVRRYGSLHALAGIDLSIRAGESVALFGANGAGKSTLLRTLATLLQPSSGAIELFGQSAHRGARALRTRIGFVSHQSLLYSDLSPAQNLAFYGRVYGVDDHSRIDELIEAVGLRGWAHRPVNTLSRGLEQRCAIARALLHRPALLLLDEPFTGLDADGVEMLTRMLDDAAAGGTTIVLSTHDIDRGLRVVQRALVLHRGQLQWDGAASLHHRSTFDEAYGRMFARTA